MAISQPRRNRAFTLIELLVVIAIIAILASILFPVFGQAKLAAKKVVDISNMKQIGTATMIYMGDYDDLFPGNRVDFGQANNSFKWSSILTIGPYVKNLEIFRNPAEQSRKAELTGTAGTFTVGPGQRPAPLSYLANALKSLENGGGTVAFGPQPGGDAAYAGSRGPIGWYYAGTTTPSVSSASGTSLDEPSRLILLTDGAEDWAKSMDSTPLPNTEIWVGSDDLSNGLDVMSLATGTPFAGANYQPITNVNALKHAWTQFAGGANYVMTDTSAKNLKVGALMKGLYVDQSRFLCTPLNP